MGSLTVRNIGEDVKKRLRLRAAANGRSMEEEIRLLLAEGAADAAVAAKPSAAQRANAGPRRDGSAPDPPHHRRRDRGLQVARPDPPPARARLRGARGDDQGGAGVRHAAVGRRDRGRARRSPTCSIRQRVRRRAHPARARHRSRRGRARDRRPDGEDGERPCRRSRDRGAARDRQADPARARHEPAMWAQPATQRNLTQLLADGVVTVGPNAGEMAESGEAGIGRMAEPLEIVAAIEALLGQSSKPLAGRRMVDHGGPDPRADRSGALHREPLVRQAGLRDRARGRRGRRRGDAGVAAR